MKYKVLFLSIFLIFTFSISVFAEEWDRVLDDRKDLESSNEAEYKMIYAQEAWDEFLDFIYTNQLDAIKVGLMDTSFYTSHHDLYFAETRYNDDSEQLKSNYSNNLLNLSVHTEKAGHPGVLLEALIDITFHEDHTSQYDKDTKELMNRMVQYGHGTHVAGILGAYYGDGLGINGMYPLAWHNGMYAYANINYDSQDYEKWYIEGFRYMIENNVRVINVSMGFDNNTKADLNAMAQKIKEYLQSQLDEGKDFLIVTSAGNDAVNAEDVNPLAKIEGEVGDHIIVVANTMLNRYLSSDSNRGDKITVAAPGHNIMSASPEGYIRLSGTSMSAPFVAGTAAMVWNILEPFQATLDFGGYKDLGSFVKYIIEESASFDKVYEDYVSSSAKQEDNGYPLLNAKAAVEMAIRLVTKENNPSQYLSDYIKEIAYLYPVMPEYEWWGKQSVNSYGWQVWSPDWEPVDLNGLLCVDMQDYDSDGEDEILAVLFNAEGNILHEQLIMFENLDGNIQIKAIHDIPVETNLFYDELYSGFRISTFTYDYSSKKLIAANYDNYREGGGSVLALYSYDGQQFIYEQGFTISKGSDDSVWCSKTAYEPDMPLSWMAVSPWESFAQTDDDILYGGIYEYMGEEYCNHIRSVEQAYESALMDYGLQWNRFNGMITDLKGMKAVNILNKAPMDKLFTEIQPLCDVNLYVKFWEEEGDDEYPEAILYTKDYTSLLDAYRQ